MEVLIAGIIIELLCIIGISIFYYMDRKKIKSKIELEIDIIRNYCLQLREDDLDLKEKEEYLEAKIVNLEKIMLI